MNNDGYRLNGGIGFSIESPQLIMSFEPAKNIVIIDNRNHGFSKEELERLNNHLRDVVNKEQFNIGYSCIIHNGVIQSHVGLGSNSMIYLSCVEALYVLNKREYEENTIVAMSGRGGTSGIGINTYFKGGFVFDTGIANHGHRILAPSSVFVSEHNSMPLLFKELRLPKWDVGICIPPVAPKTEFEEISFFQKNSPLDRRSIEPILYEAVYGVTSALVEEDYDAFCKSIDAIQQTKWKSLERSLYGEDLSKIETIIRNAGARCIGMSSLGPMLYFFGENVDGIVDMINNEIPNGICLKTTLNNSSRIIEDD